MKDDKSPTVFSSGDITLKDVAQRAKVSISTASRVLARVPGFAVKEETQRRILEAASELDYRHNTVAKTLRTKRSHALGVFLQDIESGIVPAILSGIQEGAAGLGYQVLIHWNRDAVALQKTAYEWYTDRRIDGMIFSSSMLVDERIREMEERRLPFVMLSHSSATQRYAAVDDETGMHALVEHLYGLGHRHIAFLGGPPSVGTFAWRALCFKKALAAFGLESRPELMVCGGYASWRDGIHAIQRLRVGDARFSAVVGGAVNLAVGGLSAILKTGMRVPEDLSVVSFHDAPLNEMTMTALTAVRLPIRQASAEAVRILDDALNGVEVEPVVVPGLELIVRQSSGPVAGK